MNKFLMSLAAVWTIVVIGCMTILGFSLVVVTDDRRELVYGVWAKLASVLIPVAPSIISPWLLGFIVCGLVALPFAIIEEIKKKRLKAYKRLVQRI
jgi:hypothetical protein